MTLRENRLKNIYRLRAICFMQRMAGRRAMCLYLSSKRTLSTSLKMTHGYHIIVLKSHIAQSLMWFMQHCKTRSWLPTTWCHSSNIGIMQTVIAKEYTVRLTHPQQYYICMKRSMHCPGSLEMTMNMLWYHLCSGQMQHNLPALVTHHCGQFTFFWETSQNTHMESQVQVCVIIPLIFQRYIAVILYKWWPPFMYCQPATRQFPRSLYTEIRNTCNQWNDYSLQVWAYAPGVGTSIWQGVCWGVWRRSCDYRHWQDHMTQLPMILFT